MGAKKEFDPCRALGARGDLADVRSSARADKTSPAEGNDARTHTATQKALQTRFEFVFLFFLFLSKRHGKIYKMRQGATTMGRGKRPAPSVRPQIAAAVGLCGQSERTAAQDERLAALAAGLGAPTGLRGDAVCAALRDALGDEWATAAASTDLFVEEEARAQRTRDLLAEARRERLRRGFYAPVMQQAAVSAADGARLARARFPQQAATTQTVQAPAPDDTEAAQTLSIWSMVPPELQPQIVDALVHSNPRTALLFYESSPDTVGVFRHNYTGAYTVDDHGALASQGLPLIEYARLGAAFGTGDPLGIFLRAALCVLHGVADMEADAAIRGNLRAREENVEWHNSPMTTRNAHPAYSLYVRRYGPLTDSDAGEAAQWLAWLTLPVSALARPEGAQALPVVQGYRNMDMGPVPLSGQAGDRWLIHGALGLTRDGLVADEPNLDRVRPLAFVRSNDPSLEALLGGLVPDPAAWLQLAQQPDAARAALLRRALGRSGGDRILFARLLALLDGSMGDWSSSRTCDAVAARSPWRGPTFARLFGSSTLWLVPLAGGQAFGIFADLRAPALNQAIALAGGA
ncbi:hypothetical protein pdul_cds_44 [Pandoravirus dulcis]|uniref:Uncharacterized protein n=1 Tax=Pandoravirus dulcis TaxID=1349409 RepID=S4VRD0_9VIRU|nr:hypothetical protein pdul_cds_44 [Pandoravirus dulcis]AGO81920.1 hypothetical protein pdul_cds_44 [Pandoravirus dulcis]